MLKYLQKPYLPLFLSLWIYFCVFAQNQMTIEENRNRDIILRFQLSQYQLKNVLINGEMCSRIVWPQAAYLNNRGFPRMPFIAQSVIIPGNAKMELEVDEIHYNYMNCNKIAPAKGKIVRLQNPSDIPYIFGDIYQSDTWFPENPARLGKPFILRDMRGIVVYIQPFQYNPRKGKIRIAESMSVRVKRVGYGSINILHARDGKVTSTVFSKIYHNRFINFNRKRPLYPSVSDGNRMIIITASKYAAYLAPFTLWKNQKGIWTDAYQYPSETGGTGVTAVKNFIQSKYTSENITYVLLVGNSTELPCSLLNGTVEYMPAQGASDPEYSLLAGNDKYPEVFVGRFVADSVRHVQVMVNKVLTYEKEPDTTGAWYHKACGIASADGMGGMTDKEWMDSFRNTLLTYNYTEVDQIYDPGASKNAIINAVNQGRGWIDYMGHGLIQSWVTSGFSSTDVLTLNNGDKLPVIISVACANGYFNGGPCYADAWMRHGTVAEGRGAVAFLGASLDQDWTPPQYATQEMIKHLTEDTYLSLGAIINNGEMKMLENGDGDETFLMWNLFGDPSMQVYTNTPEIMSVTHPSKIDSGTKNLTVSFDSKIDGRVCLFSETNGILGSKMVSDSSSATLGIDVANENEVLLTVTARNKAPYQKTISVGEIGISLKRKYISKEISILPINKGGVKIVFKGRIARNFSAVIYNISGRKVYELPHDNTLGEELLVWHGQDSSGNAVGKGCYFLRIVLNGKVYIKEFFLY